MRQLRIGFGSYAEAIEGSPQAIAGTLGVDVAEANRIVGDARASADAARGEREAAARVGARIVLLADDSYPELLRASPDPPELLFVRGDLTVEAGPAVAIVGTRRATAYGSLQAGVLSVALAERGVTIVSGGARGIDAEAHRGALRAGGRTVAVVATGFDRPYPAEHAGLFEAILDGGGALVTEQPSFVAARPDLFPRRNRVIAALSLVTVVIEAANRSGALLTARIAVDDLSREAACMPGPVTSALSAGCHRAIREGWAQLVTSADDVAQMLSESRTLALGAREAAERARSRPAEARAAAGDRSSHRGAPASSPPSAAACSADASSLSAAIRRLGCAGFDELERELSWSVPRIATAALELELRGRIARDAQGAFRVQSA
jgi:DNA processing protein